jgi:hypothetical protein
MIEDQIVESNTVDLRGVPVSLQTRVVILEERYNVMGQQLLAVLGIIETLSECVRDLNKAVANATKIEVLDVKS